MNPLQFIDYPFQSHFVSLHGHRLHYLDEGTGPPVVMIHGNPNWTYYWRHLITELKSRHRCLAIDHIGCGPSDKPDDRSYSYTLGQRVADLSDWIDSLEIREPISLVVHDWGGMIGSAWAVQNPDRVDRLVLLNTGAFPLPSSKPVPWQLALARTPLLGAALVRGFNAFSRGAVQSCVTRHRMSDDVADAYCAPYDTWSNRRAVHRFVQDIPLKPTDAGYELVTATAAGLSRLVKKPTMIGWGDRDFVFDHHFLAEWQRRFPNAEVHQYADCGHYILEDAGDELIPQISEFLGRRCEPTS